MRTNSQLLNQGFCCVCVKQIENTPYFFGGSVACEQCVRTYYEGEGASEECIAMELRWRAEAAAKAAARQKVRCEQCGRKYAQSRIERHRDECEGYTP